MLWLIPVGLLGLAVAGCGTSETDENTPYPRPGDDTQSSKKPNLQVTFVDNGSYNDPKSSWAHYFSSDTIPPQLSYYQSQDFFCQGHVTAKLFIDHPYPERVIPKVYATDDEGYGHAMDGVEVHDSLDLSYYYDEVMDLSANIYATDDSMYLFTYYPVGDNLRDGIPWKTSLFFTAFDGELYSEPIKWDYRILNDSSNGGCEG